MIFGGEFYNKGAQAMSFITVSRLKVMYPDHNILFVSELDSRRPNEELTNYNFDIITNPFDRNNFIGENFIRKILGRNEKPNPKDIKHLLEETEFLFDISGYELSSQWGAKKSQNYLNRLKEAHRLGIRTVMLPQSIGPFDYKEDSKEIISALQNILRTVEVIMPREKQGEQDLSEIGIEKNVKRFPDMVLTSKEPIKWDLIYKDEQPEKTFNLKTNSVGIIPNMRNFDHGNKESILGLYQETVQHLRNKGKHVYLARHSNEDIQACHLIKDMFSNDDKVQVIEEDMTPNEFEKMVEYFDFTIGSRFHSVVHSFKVGVPSIILGWATKYQEIAQLFGQEKYVFDVRENFEPINFINMVKQMDKTAEEESKVIIEKMREVNDFGDPYDYAFNLLNQ